MMSEKIHVARLYEHKRYGKVKVVDITEEINAAAPAGETESRVVVQFKPMQGKLDFGAIMSREIGVFVEGLQYD